jgi:hypothetical protein
VSLALGVIALCAVFAASGSMWEPAWQFLAYVAVISLIAAVVNLIPFRTGTTYSDGAHLYHLLAGGPWADLHRALSIGLATTVTPLRPRDYDIDAIQRASAAMKQGLWARQLRMMASSYYLDWGRIPEATAAMVEAETILHASASEVRAEAYPWFIYRKVVLQHDAAGARELWDTMAAKGQISPGVGYCLAQSALLWIEKRQHEAREAWDKGMALLKSLPGCGDDDFDRDRFELLRTMMDESTPEEHPLAESARNREQAIGDAPLQPA